MFINQFFQRNKVVRHLSTLALTGAALLITTTSASANSGCFQVKGHYEEHIETQNCNSPINFCIAGVYGGVVQGDFFGAASAINPTGDTGTTGVLTFTSDSVIHANVHGKQGDLNIKNAGAFQSTGEGNIVDVQFITGGTGELSGASGVMRASGLFDSATGVGASDYEGMICLP